MTVRFLPLRLAPSILRLLAVGGVLFGLVALAAVVGFWIHTEDTRARTAPAAVVAVPVLERTQLSEFARRVR